jgi:catechol 2,3-dioxygenase-like lactoylglutathione lyase family enzyme
MTRIERVRHIALAVADVDAVLRFYRDTLGLSPVSDADVDGRREVLLPAGKSALLLREREEDGGIEEVCFDTAGGPPVPAPLPREEHLGLPISLVATCPPGASPGGQVECIDHLVISSGNSAVVAAHFRDKLGLEIKRTMARPGTGNHLEFGKLVDVVLEFAGPPEPRPGEVKAAFWGIVFTVKDIALVVAACRAAGYETTDPRPAVQPGAMIAAVKHGTGGVPFALIQYNAIAVE